MANDPHDITLNHELRDVLDEAGVETTSALPLQVQVPTLGPHKEPIPSTGILPYSLEDVGNPLGTNDLGAAQLFEERKMYKETPYFMGLPEPLESWYDKLYFGRVDRIQNGIILRKENNGLKQIPTGNGNIFALNFVVDAFMALKQYMRAFGDAGQITKISLFYDLTAVSAFHNPYQNLDALRNIWSTSLAERIIASKPRNSKTIDFKSYVKELLSYMKAGTNRRPITVTGYMVSNFSSPMNSGLSIQLANEDYGADAPKLHKYIMDPNFRFFARAARKFGFYVDRNAPWRIIADPFSTPMLQRMASYLKPADGPPESRFFHHYYQRTYMLEWGTPNSDPRYPYGLQGALKKMYNDFAENYPSIRTTTEATVRCPQRSISDRVTTVATRRAVEDMELWNYGDMYWLDLYFKIRLYESGVKFSNYDSRLRTLRQIYKSPHLLNVHDALRYVNNEIKPYLYNLRVGAKSLTREAGPVRIGSVKDY